MSIEDLIIRDLQGRTTPMEAALLHEWRESSPECEEEYRELARLWSLLATASPIDEADIAPDVDLIVAKVDGYAIATQPSAEPISFASAAAGRERLMLRRSDRRVRPILLGTLAASLAVVALGLGLISGRVSAPAAESVYRTVATSSEAGVTLTLYDGTAVRLAPSSELQVIGGGDHPVVRLRGRAYFGVVPDPSRTFTVKTEFGDATALGTRFAVRADERELQVLVVQGNVRVSSAGSAVEIGQGMMSRNAEGGPLSTSRVEDVESLLDWVGQTLVFRATPLSAVVAEIERRYGVTVTLEEASLGLLEVTAIFTDQPVEEVIFVVCRIVGARCALDEGRFRIGIESITSGIPRPESSLNN